MLFQRPPFLDLPCFALATYSSKPCMPADPHFLKYVNLIVVRGTIHDQRMAKACGRTCK